MSYDLIEITLNRVGEQLPDRLSPSLGYGSTSSSNAERYLNRVEGLAGSGGGAVVHRHDVPAPVREQVLQLDAEGPRRLGGECLVVAQDRVHSLEVAGQGVGAGDVVRRVLRDDLGQRFHVSLGEGLVASADESDVLMLTHEESHLSSYFGH